MFALGPQNGVGDGDPVAQLTEAELCDREPEPCEPQPVRGRSDQRRLASKQCQPFQEPRLDQPRNKSIGNRSPDPESLAYLPDLDRPQPPDPVHQLLVSLHSPTPSRSLSEKSSTYLLVPPTPK